MPKMGDAMEEGTILRWLKREGDAIEAEEIVLEIQTEKATIEVPSYDDGVLARILVQEGQTVPVGEPIAEITGAGEEAAAAPSAKAPGEQVAASSKTETSDAQVGLLDEVDNGKPPETEAPGGHGPDGGGEPPQIPSNPTADLGPAPEAGGTATAVRPPGERLKASPLARKMAQAEGLDLAALRGTGPNERIVAADVEQALRTRQTQPAAQPQAQPSTRPTTPAKPPVLVPGQDQPVTPMRAVIARRLTESKTTVPHFYLTIDVDMEPATALRAQYNAQRPDAKITFNDFIVKACARGIQQLPQVAYQWGESVIRAPEAVNIGVAVAIEGGLIVPVVRNADQKSLSQLSAEVKQLAGKARDNKLTPNDYSGGTFTISNLGMYDIEQFQAIINPPESAILAVGAIQDVPVVKDGAVVPGKRMKLTISVDHRAVDGATAAQFLQEVKRLLQNPLALFE